MVAIRPATKGGVVILQRRAKNENGILNPWDVQSKHIHTVDGKASTLYAGDCRWGGWRSLCADEDQALAYGFDSYNQGLWEEVMPTIRAGGGGDQFPKVLCTRSKK